MRGKSSVLLQLILKSYLFLFPFKMVLKVMLDEMLSCESAKLII